MTSKSKQELDSRLRGNDERRQTFQKIRVNNQYNDPDSRIAAGKVSTQAIARLRSVPSCRPERLAAIAPATPEESTCVVDTGSPYMSAAAIVLIATSSALAPCA